MQTSLTLPERLGWSADVSEERLYTLLGITPGVTTPDDLPAEGLHHCLVKLDRVFRDVYGDRAFFVLKALDINVFSDMKLAEIPTKIEELAKVHLASKPYMLNIMANSASTMLVEDENPDHIDGLKRFADMCHQAGTLPCGVTCLTTQTEATVGHLHNGRSRVDQVLGYTGLLVRCGFTDVVCSVNEAAAVFAEFPGIGINCAGIRRTEDATHDQVNRNTPVAALEAGVTRLIVGRPLTNGDTAQNCHDFLVEMATANLPRQA